MLKKTYNRESYELLVLYHIGQLENSIHFIFDKQTKECAIIDPAWEADLFLEIIKEKGYSLTQIWLTHWHPDHTNATDELASKTGATVKIGVNELEFLQVDSELELLPDNAEFSFGGTNVNVIETGGHSFGGICYILSDDIFVGDTLFVYGAGHCALPKANPEQFFYSMQKIKQVVPEHVYLRCGHNYGSEITTTIGEQKLHNPFLLIDNLNDFVTYRQEIHDKTRTYPMDKVTKEQLSAIIHPDNIMLAIFGGSFDPIHLGHLQLAQEVQQQLQFEEFMFLPCGEPPHKNKLLFSQQQRLEMLNASIQTHPHFQVSDFEFNGKVSYTIDTLKHFHAQNQRLCFIMGSDSFNDLPNWEYYQDFKNLTNILVIDRSNTTSELFGFEQTSDIAKFKNSVGKVYFFSNELINISSTEIRSKIHNLENISHMVPKNIITLIDEYRTNTTNYKRT